MNRTQFLTGHEPMDDIFSTLGQAVMKNYQHGEMLSIGCMSKARHPRPYNDEQRKQMTVAWKVRVLERLEENRVAGLQPANIEQLTAAVGAAKGGLNRTFDLNAKMPQNSSSYVDKICEVLNIDPPLNEFSADDQRDVTAFVKFSPDTRRRLIGLGFELEPK